MRVLVAAHLVEVDVDAVRGRLRARIRHAEAGGVGHGGAHGDVRGTGFGHGADPAAVEGGVHLEWGHVGRDVVHVATHARAHRHDGAGDEHLTLLQLREGHGLESEVLRGGGRLESADRMGA